jgi:hypothetical protein
MDASEPQVRRRGYFLNSADSFETEPGEEAAAEGITIRVRIIRPRLKRRAAGVMRRTALRPTRPGDRHPASRRHSS